MSSKVKTETVLVTVAYRIRYCGEGGRDNALEELEDCPLEVSGCGQDGTYNVTRGKVISVAPIAKGDL